MNADSPRVEVLKEHSIPDLLRELSNETVTLVRQEMDLAKAELTEKSRPAVASAGMFGGTAIFGLGAFGALTTAIIAALALVLQVWLAALIVAVVYGVVAYVLVQSGKKKLQEAAPLIPEQAAQSVREDIEWAKTRAKSAGK